LNGLFHLVVFASGLILLIKGADLVTDHAAAVARRSGISQLIIGITLVAASTSLPELAVSLFSAITNTAQIATGTIIGSNIANIGMVLGISALTVPLFSSREFLREVYGMLAFTSVLSFLLLWGLVWYEGIVLLSGFFLYNFYLFRSRPKKTIRSVITSRLRRRFTKSRPGVHLLFVASGSVLVILGANMLVTSTINIAEWLGVPELVIALIVIAIGTSLPEFVTSFVAALKKMRAISIGNIVGSNIFNTAILGMASLFRTVPATPSVVFVDIPAMILLSVMLFIFMRTGWKISRLEGAIMLMVYLIFIYLQFL